jgi:hypothetical protein
MAIEVGRFFNMYTVWNWFVVVAALLWKGPGRAALRQFAQGNSFVVLISIVWIYIIHGPGFFVRLMHHNIPGMSVPMTFVIDAVVHWLPVALLGLPTVTNVYTFAPVVTLAAWYAANRKIIGKIYMPAPTTDYDKIVVLALLTYMVPMAWLGR